MMVMGPSAYLTQALFEPILLFHLTDHQLPTGRPDKGVRNEFNQHDQKAGLLLHFDLCTSVCVSAEEGHSGMKEPHRRMDPVQQE